MYSELNTYCNTLSSIKFIAWWTYAKYYPRKLKQVSCVVAVFLGAQPKGLQNNFGGYICCMCEGREYESPEHILFRCQRFTEARDRCLSNINSLMPVAMRNEFMNLGLWDKCKFILPGLHNTYVGEWHALYGAIADFVWKMYRLRNVCYNPP